MERATFAGNGLGSFDVVIPRLKPKVLAEPAVASDYALRAERAARSAWALVKRSCTGDVLLAGELAHDSGSLLGSVARSRSDRRKIHRRPIWRAGRWPRRSQLVKGAAGDPQERARLGGGEDIGATEGLRRHRGVPLGYRHGQACTCK